MPAQKHIDRLIALESAADSAPQRGGVVAVEGAPFATPREWHAAADAAVAAAIASGREPPFLVVGQTTDERAWELGARRTAEALRRPGFMGWNDDGPIYASETDA